MSEEKKKLCDEEKTILINFYKANPALWDSSDVYYKNKNKKEAIKQDLVKKFNGAYSSDNLEKTFHSLRSSMLREVKRNAGSEVPSRKWKFYDQMEFIINDLTKEKKKSQFTSEETEELIDYYREHSALWNHTLQDYRDRVLRESLMPSAVEKRAQLFGSTVADSLLQCDQKDWPMLKKKIMDIFFEYEEHKQQQPAPHNLQARMFPAPTFIPNTPSYPMTNAYTGMLQSPPLAPQCQPYSPANSSCSNDTF